MIIDSTAAAESRTSQESGTETLPRNASHDMTTQPQDTWPLAGTKLPHAHLTWAEWVDLLTNGTTTEQTAQVTSKRAA